MCERGRERETEVSQRTPHWQQGTDAGLELMNARSWPEQKSDAYPTEPPGYPCTLKFLKAQRNRDAQFDVPIAWQEGSSIALNNIKLYLPVIKIGPRERHTRMCQHSMQEECQLPRMKRKDENFSKNSALHLIWHFHLENLKTFG